MWLSSLGNGSTARSTARRTGLESDSDPDNPDNPDIATFKEFTEKDRRWKTLPRSLVFSKNEMSKAKKVIGKSKSFNE